jgi:hypothetical protein
VDPHDGYPHDRPRPTYEPYLRNLRRYGVLDQVTPVRARFQVVPVEQADVAVADLTGNRALMEQFLAHVRHVPIVMVHDYARTNCRGTTEAFDAWIRQTGRRVYRVDSYVVAY